MNSSNIGGHGASGPVRRYAGPLGRAAASRRTSRGWKPKGDPGPPADDPGPPATRGGRKAAAEARRRPSHTPDHPRVRRIKNVVASHPVFEEMLNQPNLIAVLKDLLGPNLRLHGSKLNMKAADYGSPVEWHQDWAFYPHTNDDVLAVGVMLDDMAPENGPLMIVPGSHKGPTYDHHQDGRFVGGVDIEAAGVDVSPAAMITGRAGACSFHHVRAVHGSAKNTSDQDRRLLLYQIAAGDAWDIRGMPTEESWDAYAATFIAGTPTIEPRVIPAPIRLPYPGPLKGGSIYESQTIMTSKTFGAVEDS